MYVYVCTYIYIVNIFRDTNLGENQKQKLPRYFRLVSVTIRTLLKAN